MEACHCVVLLLVWSVLVQSEPSCDQTEFLHPSGTCVACPLCLPGEQLSEDCGFGDGGGGVCVPCEEGRFSTETGVAPCRRCTRCAVLNRRMERACSPTSDTQCGQCLPGYYELRSMTGEAELLCVPCRSHDTVHKDCLLSTAQGSKPAEGAVAAPARSSEEPEGTRVRDKTTSVVLVGSATASLVFLIALLLWLCLLTAERFKQAGECCLEPEGLSPPAHRQHTPPNSLAKRAETSSEVYSQTEDLTRGLNSLSAETEVHPPSIVINVTTNIKPHDQHEDRTEEEPKNFNTDEMERKLQAIWETAQGQSIEMLDYDSVQDLSLLLDSEGSTGALRRLGWSLGVPPQVVAHVRDFQDLFRYLRTSTHTLLPQLAQAAALLPNPAVVSRIHRAVVNK